MKKRYLIFLFLFSTQISFAQKWCAPGATWHYSNVFILTPDYGYTRFKAVGDTIIQGKTCDVIEVLDTGWNFFSGPFSFRSFEYTYADSNIVYQFKNNQFYMLYNFNAQPGDHWEIYADTIPFNCPAIPAVIVDSIGTIVINTDSLRIMWTSPYNGSWFGLGTIVEKMGSLSFLFTSGGCVLDAITYDFRCYSDSLGWSYQSGIVPSCDYIIGIDDLDSENSVISVFPNPTGAEISIQLSEEKESNTSFQLYDLMGEKILSGQLTKKNNRIDLSEFPSGVYFISILSKDKMLTKKIIKL